MDRQRIDIPVAGLRKAGIKDIRVIVIRDLNTCFPLSFRSMIKLPERIGNAGHFMDRMRIIVFLALIRIAERLIDLIQLAGLLLREFLISVIIIRVKRLYQIPVGLFDLILRCIAFYTKCLVIVHTVLIIC